MRTTTLLTVFFFLAGLSTVAADYRDYVKSDPDTITRDQVIQNMERRKKQLETLLSETKKKIAMHHSGEETLELEEKERLEKRIEIVNKKLERMQDVDEREIERMQRREARRYERRRERAREL